MATENSVVPPDHWEYLDHALAWVRASLAHVGARRLDEVPADARTRLAAEINHRQAEMQHAETSFGESLPIVALRIRWKLTTNETAILLFALAQRMDPATAPLLTAASGDTTDLTGRLLEDLLGHGLRERLQLRHALAPESTLSSAGLLLIQPSPHDPTDVTVRITERGIQALLQNTTPPETSPRLPVTPLIAPEWILHRIQHSALSNLSTPPTYTVLITGATGVGKTTAALFLVHAAGREPIFVESSKIIADPPEISRLFYQVATMGNAALIIDDCEGLFQRAIPRPRVTDLFLKTLSRHAGLVVLTTTHPDMLDETVVRSIHTRVDLPMPGVAERIELWRVKSSMLSMIPPPDCESLARQFDLTGAQIHNAAWVTSRAPNPAPRDLIEACRMQLQQRYKHATEPKSTRLRLHDLILPPSTLARVESFLAAAKSRPKVLDEWGFGDKFSSGLGLSALFDGDPGTGKTLCAEIIADELGLYVHRVNIAQVLNKYVGETEKNLARIFQEASAASALLLFDEADALFSSRINVENSQDRFANLEINLLLQLMERYFGVVILTTNLKHGIDKAFERRIGYKIHFPFPDAHLREHIWQTLLPDGAPTSADLDFYDLAQRFELSGGSIKNALLRASYAAAAQGSPITAALLEEAAEQECEASGKLFRPVQRSERSIL